jgi:hypothetical protein
VTDERELLLAYLAQQRDGIRYAAFGLRDDQARLAPTASTLTIGGLVKHVDAMERSWMDLVLQRPAATQEEQEATWQDGFALGADEALVDALARYDELAKETDAVLAGIDLDQPVPVPKGVPWFPADVEAWTVRWVVLHIIEETARHAGHADIIRESIDGATMHPLMAAAEGWPATEWLQPWRPSS